MPTIHAGRITTHIDGPFVQSRNASHLPAWKVFNQNIEGDGTVGIWHETYQVATGRTC